MIIVLWINKMFVCLLIWMLYLFIIDGELLYLHPTLGSQGHRRRQLARLQRCQSQTISISWKITWIDRNCRQHQTSNPFLHPHSQPSRPYLCFNSAEWDDQMPFPVLDRTRYVKYGLGIASLLVHDAWQSSSTLTTTTSSPPTSVTAPSETYSPSSWPTSSLMPIPHIANKSSKLTFLTNIATWDHRNLSSKTSTCSIILVFDSAYRSKEICLVGMRFRWDSRQDLQARQRQRRFWFQRLRNNPSGLRESICGS